LSSSNISGKTTCNLSLYDFFSDLAFMSHGDYLRIIEDTPFSAMNKYTDYTAVVHILETFVVAHIADDFAMANIVYRTDITRRIGPRVRFDFSDNDTLLHNILNSFAYYKAVFYYSDKGLAHVTGNFSNSVSKHIGIHRFHRTGFPGIFASNAFSLNAMKGPSLDEMVCFLRIYNPTFYKGVDTSLFNPNCIREGDSTMNVQSISAPEILQFLFNFTSSNLTVRNNGNQQGGNGGNHNTPLARNGVDLEDEATPFGPGGGKGKKRKFSTHSMLSTKQSSAVINSYSFDNGIFYYTNSLYSSLNYVKSDSHGTDL